VSTHDGKREEKAAQLSRQMIAIKEENLREVFAGDSVRIK
jgi:hypothetical protein